MKDKSREVIDWDCPCVLISLFLIFSFFFIGTSWAQMPQCSAVSCSLNNQNEGVCGVTCPDGNTYGWMPPAVTNDQGPIIDQSMRCSGIFCAPKNDGTLACGITCPDGFAYRIQAVDRVKIN